MMKKFRFGSVILPLVLISPSLTAGTAQTASPQEVAAGQKLAQKLCAKCHAVAKTGDSPNIKAPPFRAFVKKWPVESLEEALAEGIVVGEHIMPEFEFEPEQITNLLAYIKSLSETASK